MDVLFQNAAAVTMDGPVLQNAFVGVSNGKITYVGTSRPDGPVGRVVDCTGKLLMPGLVNTHTHIPMTLMRGYGGGHDLQDWLNNYIFPAEARLDSRAVRAGAGLALAELIASGVTCIADMYYFCGDIIEEVISAGISGNISRGITCFSPLDDPAEYPPCRETRELAERWNNAGQGQIKVDVSIHGEYTSYLAPNLWEYLARYAKDNGLGMQVHVSETRSEHEECVARHGVTPLQILDRYGVWDVRSVIAHGVWCTDEDFALMAEKGITVAHNPVSNLKLGSGVARVPDMLKAGVNVALGTDGVSSNNSHDMFEEIKLASILHCGVTRDPMAVTAADALKMATVNGAKALGRNTGRVAVGCDADLILLDGGRANLIPCHDPVENLAYAAHGSDVVMNMARGRIIYENGTFLTLDLEQIREEVERYALPLLFG